MGVATVFVDHLGTDFVAQLGYHIHSFLPVLSLREIDVHKKPIGPRQKSTLASSSLKSQKLMRATKEQHEFDKAS